MTVAVDEFLHRSFALQARLFLDLRVNPKEFLLNEGEKYRILDSGWGGD